MAQELIEMTPALMVFMNRAHDADREYRANNYGQPTHLAMHTMTLGALYHAAGCLDDADPDATPFPMIFGLSIATDERVKPGVIEARGRYDTP